MAHQTKRIWELEMLFRKKALERIREIGKDRLLFVNVDPDVIKSPEFKSGLTKEYLESLGGEETSIVFEITERTAIRDYEAFQKVLDHYRNMDLIRNIDKDAFKQALIKAFVDTSITTNIKIIAEGIETKEELKTLILLGVHAGQGFFLKKPSRDFIDIDNDIKTRILDYNKISKNLNEYSQEYHYISNLVTNHYMDTYEPMVHCNTVKNHMDKVNSKSVCICENKRPVGIVMKHNINSSMSGQYGFSLFSNKPISKIMNSNPLVIDYYTPISVVAKSAMERRDEELFDDVVVTKHSKFYGLVSMKKIFEYTLLFEKNNAKEHNPLSGLPGNPIINRVLSDVVNYKNKSCILYVDINEFKIYNDVYGFEKGDIMINYLAKMMTDLVKNHFPYSSFVGHIGGDDFILLIDADRDQYHMICKMILNQFEKDKESFFSNEHFLNGAIESEDRFGVIRNITLTSISIAGLYGELSDYESSEKLSEDLAIIKKKVKKKGYSSYLLKEISPSVVSNHGANNHDGTDNVVGFNYFT